jgi:hypothetical protein
LHKQAPQGAAVSAQAYAVQAVAQGTVTQPAPSTAALSPTLLQTPQVKDASQTAVGQASNGLQAAQTASAELQGTLQCVDGVTVLVRLSDVDPALQCAPHVSRCLHHERSVAGQTQPGLMWSCGLGMCKDMHSVLTSLFKKVLTCSQQAMLVFKLKSCCGTVARHTGMRARATVCAQMCHAFHDISASHTHEQARAEYMHSGHVCMTVGCKLHELVSRLGSTVIPDTAPKVALATPTGLNADLHAGCHNDVHNWLMPGGSHSPCVCTGRQGTCTYCTETH